MEETKTKNQPQLGCWDKLPNEEVERKPKVIFDINKSVEVKFTEDSPNEFSGADGCYYLFNVVENNEPKVIMTSAWSLLKNLKIFSPLSGKKLRITKKLDKGKQHFEVEEIK